MLLTLKSVYRLPLRALQGFAMSLRRLALPALPMSWCRCRIDPCGRKSLTHPHTRKTQAQRGIWLVSHGSVEIGSLDQNRVGTNKQKSSSDQSDQIWSLYRAARAIA